MPDEFEQVQKKYMYVCIWIYIHTYIYPKYVHVCAYVYMYINLHVYKYTSEKSILERKGFTRNPSSKFATNSSR